MSKFKKLDKNIDVDVLIIGGGMTGINTLYQLKKSSLEVVLVEQNKIGMGVTVNSTGKLSVSLKSLHGGQGLIFGPRRISTWLAFSSESGWINIPESVAFDSITDFFALLNCFFSFRALRQKLTKNLPIDVSNVAIVDPKTKKATRVGYKVENGSHTVEGYVYIQYTAK